MKFNYDDLPPLSDNMFKYGHFVWLAQMAELKVYSLIVAGIVVALLEITGGYMHWPSDAFRMPEICYAVGVLSAIFFALQRYSVFQPNMTCWWFLIAPLLVSYTLLWILCSTSQATMASLFLWMMLAKLVSKYAKPLGAIFYKPDNI